MSLRVDLSLVRFSPIENTYYFYDQNYPTAIQFLLNGQWESWDVGWVRHNAHDPEIKNIAAGAEAHAARNSSYKQWPSTPLPRVVPVVQPLSPSVISDVSRQRDPFDRPRHPQERDSPLSPQFSPGLTRDFFPSTALNASLPPLAKSRPAFSPALNSHSPSHSLTIEATTPSISEHSHHDRPLANPSPASHGGTASAPHKCPQGVPLALPKIGQLPLISSPSPSSDASTLASFPPPLSVPTDTAVSVPIPVQQPGPHASQSRNARYKDYHSPAGQSDPNTDPQLSTVAAPITLGPHTASRTPSRTSSPLGDYHDIYQESGAAPSVQTPQPPSLLPRRRRDFKIILSLDGDGIRGLSQAFLVEAFVGAICTKLDQNIDPYQIFDLVGGTSLGGVLGLMLSRLRMQAHSAREAYKLVAKEVFQDKKAYFVSLDPHATPLQYHAEGVENAIKAVIAGELAQVDARLYDDREESADAFTITTQVKIGSNKAAVLRTYPTRRIAGPNLSDDVLIWQAMKAAVLAPRYTAPQDGRVSRSVIEPGQMDYGTTKDNPTREANYECRKLLRYSNDKVIIISIGTGSGVDSERENGEMMKSVLRRTADAERQCFEFQRDNAELINAGWMKYFRFNVPNLDDVPLEEWCNEEQIRDRTTAYLACPDTGGAFHQCVDDVTAVLVGVPR
ncbi:hypothetical protein DPSP01_002657 [Paraphaeosphaeria sporulosa]|uniref:FabD/lysophospholipase-like protein n=1 Tax=Paraphaeosphaeria sporulosa TaxID=1460663 RepID=A0A177CCR2_9PLEO|nr:FabD/lysophospholipase-like protein [Paraphaeosphaeria sporulosa]OAG05423.1 FabD/lysophospholipase-like protein [Paraphaeosphaeria sporulosa]